MTESASNQFELEIDPEWTREDIAMRLRAIADLIEQGYNQGQFWDLDLEWDPDAVQFWHLDLEWDPDAVQDEGDDE